MSFAVIVLEDHEAPSGLRILPRDTALIGKGAPSLACQEYSHQQLFKIIKLCISNSILCSRCTEPLKTLTTNCKHCSYQNRFEPPRIDRSSLSLLSSFRDLDFPQPLNNRKLMIKSIDTFLTCSPRFSLPGVDSRRPISENPARV